MTTECERFHVLMHGYLDEELAPDEERAVRDHISSCGECAKLFAEMRELAGDLNRMSLDFAEADIWDRVGARILPQVKANEGRTLSQARWLHSWSSINL